jgi:hypothetical protein
MGFEKPFEFLGVKSMLREDLVDSGGDDIADASGKFRVAVDEGNQVDFCHDCKIWR